MPLNWWPTVKKKIEQKKKTSGCRHFRFISCLFAAPFLALRLNHCFQAKLTDE